MQENSYHEQYRENSLEAHRAEASGRVGAGGTSPSLEDLRRKVKTNIIIAWICIGASIVLLIGFIILALISAGVINFGGEKIKPTPELAKSVCERRGGEFEQETSLEGSILSWFISDADINSAYLCDKENEFSYAVIFLNNKNPDTLLKYFQNAKDNPDFHILEYSDDFKKVYATNIRGHQFTTMYDGDIFAFIIAQDALKFVDDLMAELGFPDRNRAEDALSEGKSGYYLEVVARETLEKWSEQILQYMTDNAGRLPKIDGDKFAGRESFCNNADTSTGPFDCLYDIDIEKQYKVLEFKAYESLASSPFANDQSALYTVPSNEIYVFYGTSCDGDRLVSSQNSRKFALARSNLDKDGIFCEDND